MSSFVPSCSPARSDVDKIKAKLSDLSKDLDKFAPEHRSQVMVDRLRQQKLRAMISLAKAQHYLAETDVLIADYNLQAVAEEFEHMKKERYFTNTDVRPPQSSESKEEKLVVLTDSPASNGNPKDTVCCTSFPPALGNSKSKDKGTECTPKLSTQLVDAFIHRSKTDSYTHTLKNIQPMNEIDGSEPISKVTKATFKSYEPNSSKTYKESSSKTKEATTSKTKEATTSKPKEATTSKTKEAITSKTKEATTSKTKEATTSNTKEAITSQTNEATSSAKEADTDMPSPGLKSKKRKRSKSKSKESKRHKSSHKHAKSSHATVTASNAPSESTHAFVASSNVNTVSLEPLAPFHAPAASSNVNTALHGSAASSIIHTAFLRALASPSLVPAASSFMPAASSFMPAATFVPDRDYLKPNRTYKEKTLLNTSISPIKKIVEAKGVQTDEKASKNDIVQTDVVKTLTKGVQTDNVIILQIGSDPAREGPLDIADEDTLLLDTLPVPHSHSAAVNLAKALQEINYQKSSVPDRLRPTKPNVSHVLSQNDVLHKIEVIVEDEADAVEESPVAVKMEVPDGDFPNTSTEILVNNLYKDMMKAKEQKTREGMKPKGKVTKRELWKILDEC